MNDIDKDIYIKYGQLNIKNNSQITNFNNLETNNYNVEFYKYKDLTPYCDNTYNLFLSKKNTIIPYNENLNINDYCNK